MVPQEPSGDAPARVAPAYVLPRPVVAGALFPPSPPLEANGSSAGTAALRTENSSSLVPSVRRRLLGLLLAGEQAVPLGPTQAAEGVQRGRQAQARRLRRGSRKQGYLTKHEEMLQTDMLRDEAEAFSLLWPRISSELEQLDFSSVHVYGRLACFRSPARPKLPHLV